MINYFINKFNPSEGGVKLIVIWVSLMAFIHLSTFFTEYPLLASYIFSLAIFVAYMISLKVISSNLMGDHNDIWLIPLIYSLTVVLIAVCFSVVIGYLSVDSLGLPAATTNIELIYFLVVTLTTVGFGDIKVTEDVGYTFIIFVSLLGTSHMIIFTAMVLRKLTQNTEE